MAYSLAELNHMSRDEFEVALGNVFEHTPAIARQVWHQRPFSSVDDLHQAMVAVMQQMTEAEQLALIQAHPDLGSRAQMADASVEEQASVGLNQLSPDNYDRFQRLNRQYTEKFGFPFIIAVKHHTQTTILQAFETRLQESIATEKQRAIAEIAEIARLRLLSLIPVTA